MSLSTIKKVIDIKETEECQKVFTLIFKHNDDSKEKLFSFAMTDEEANKPVFLKTLCRQMANNACTADAVCIYLREHSILHTYYIFISLFNTFISNIAF